MEALSHFVVRHRRLVGLVWLVALLAGAFAASGLTSRLDQSFSMPGQKGYAANQAILKQYGNGAGEEPLVPVLTMPAGTTLDDPTGRAEAAKAFAAVAALPGYRVVSYADTHDPVFVSADRRTTFGLVYPKLPPHSEASSAVGAAADRVAAVVRQNLPAGVKADVTGMIPLALGTGASAGGPGVLAETLIGGIGALAVLAFVFASFLALVPLIVAAVSILSSFLVIFGLTEVMKVSSLVQFLVALIGLGVAIDYSLLLVTRWREELARGRDNETAVHNAMATAGRAVAFSGLTVGLGLLALVLLPVPFLRSMGVGGMVIPLISVAVTLTLVPVLLTGAGRRLDRPRLRTEGRAARGWTGWARFVVRHRVVAAAAALLVLVVLGGNALTMTFGDPKPTSLAQSGPARAGLDALRGAGIPTGVLTPIEVVVPSGTDPAPVARRLSGVPGVDTTLAPASAEWHSADGGLVDVLPTRETTTAASRKLVDQVRTAAETAVPGALTGGSGALTADMVSAIYGDFPQMLAVIAVVTFILLARAFRSIVLPLKAVLLNLLSVGAVFGAVTLVWQDGYGSEAIGGIPAAGTVTAWIPLMIFAFLYGLSMDYEVFILARMREEYDRAGDTTRAVVEGIGRTGRLVTSAALILFLAFASLAGGPEVQLKVFATGLGAGILLDATVVRALLVPALVSLFGRWNWWLPGWAARTLRVPRSPARQDAHAALEQELQAAG